MDHKFNIFQLGDLFNHPQTPFGDHQTNGVDLQTMGSNVEKCRSTNPAFGLVPDPQIPPNICRTPQRKQSLSFYPSNKNIPDPGLLHCLFELELS